MEKTKEEKTAELIISLEQERDHMYKKGMFIQDHNETIEYLKSGNSFSIEYENDLLDAAKEDFDTLYSDYCS